MNTELTDLAVLAEHGAERIAREAHQGQVDKSGRPYIEHCERIVRRLRTPIERAVGWLHDVVEDTDVTLVDLYYEGLGDEIVEAVDAITHRNVKKGESVLNEPRVTYYERVRANPIALVVKLADIADNTDPRRLLLLPVGEMVRLMQKYAKALDALEGT